MVAVDGAGFEGATICCAYVPSPGFDVPPVTLKKHLTRAIPHYMLPVRWMVLDRMPLNGNGKTARPLLKEWFLQQAMPMAAPKQSEICAAVQSTGEREEDVHVA